MRQTNKQEERQSWQASRPRCLQKESSIMNQPDNFKSVAFREKLTEVVLETLASVPEIPKSIFVWNHYCGCSVQQIAERLDRRSAEIEATLDAIDRVLRQRIRQLVSQDRATDKHFWDDENDWNKQGWRQKRCQLAATIQES